MWLEKVVIIGLNKKPSKIQITYRKYPSRWYKRWTDTRKYRCIPILLLAVHRLYRLCLYQSFHNTFTIKYLCQVAIIVCLLKPRLCQGWKFPVKYLNSGKFKPLQEYFTTCRWYQNRLILSRFQYVSYSGRVVLFSTSSCLHNKMTILDHYLQ